MPLPPCDRRPEHGVPLLHVRARRSRARRRPSGAAPVPGSALGSAGRADHGREHHRDLPALRPAHRRAAALRGDANGQRRRRAPEYLGGESGPPAGDPVRGQRGALPGRHLRERRRGGPPLPAGHGALRLPGPVGSERGGRLRRGHQSGQRERERPAGHRRGGQLGWPAHGPAGAPGPHRPPGTRGFGGCGRSPGSAGAHRPRRAPGPRRRRRRRRSGRRPGPPGSHRARRSRRAPGPRGRGWHGRSAGHPGAHWSRRARRARRARRRGRCPGSGRPHGPRRSRRAGRRPGH